MIKSFAFFICLTFTSLVYAERPDGEITLETMCICKDKTSYSGKECSTFCKSKSHRNFILYGKANLSSLVTLNTSLISESSPFGSLETWCNQQTGTDESNPKCVMQIGFDKYNEHLTLDVQVFPNLDIFKVQLDAVPRKKNISFQLVELTSGARSAHKVLVFQ